MSGTFLHDDAREASCACLQAQEALIVAGGAIDIDQLVREAAILKAKGGLLIAADRGLEALEAAKLIPDVAVGDFDSVKPEVLENFSRCPGIRFERHRPEKNQSDTELAFFIAREAGVKKLTLMGVTGTRLDHVLSNIHLLREGEAEGVDCCLLDAHNRIRMARSPMVFCREENPFTYISFIPLSAEVTGITLRGFKYPLTDYHMALGKECSLCVSNELAEREGMLTFREGSMLAIESCD